MATDDVLEEPGGGSCPFKMNESAGHGSESPSPAPSLPRAPRAYAPLVAPTILADVFNLIFPGIMDAMTRGVGPSDRMILETIAFALAGVGAGQFGLLAVWAVLGPWPLFRQWFAVWLVGLGLFAALVLGITAVEHHGGPSGKEFLQIILALSAALVAVQLPLGLMRLVRGWRLVPRGTDAAATAIKSRQLQIRDILIAMTVLAVALGSAKSAFAENGGRPWAYYMLSFLVSCIFITLWSALVLPICLWVSFGAGAIRFRIMVLAGYLAALTAIPVGVVLVVQWASGRMVVWYWEPLVCGLLVHAGLLATLFSGLGLARACGYVLVSVRSVRRRPAPLDGGKAAAGL